METRKIDAEHQAQNIQGGDIVDTMKKNENVDMMKKNENLDDGNNQIVGDSTKDKKNDYARCNRPPTHKPLSEGNIG
jgi:hypothetical protein